MKKIILVLLLFFAFSSGLYGKFKLEDFAIGLEQITSSPKHIWVNSGYTTVNPMSLAVLGVKDFYSPPLGTKGFNLSASIKADSISIADGPNYGKGDVGLLYSSGTWYPHKVVRTGTYHHLKGNKLYSFSVSSELVPLFGQAGFLEKIKIKNRSNHSVKIEIEFSIQPGKLLNEPLSKWGYSIARWNAPDAELENENKWQNGKARITLYEQDKTTELQPNQSMTTYVAIVAQNVSENFTNEFNFLVMENKSVEAWTRRLEKCTQNIPELQSDIPGLKEYYYRSIMSGLVCIWENNNYLLNPHLATCGMDGGGMCSYLWDIAGYSPRMIITMLGSEILDIAKQMVRIDLEKYYAFTMDGSGIGVKYAYSPSAFTKLVANIFQFLGPNKELYNAARQIILNDEKREDAVTLLIDYGEQHNLLEMRSTGWEHVVVSPNAERVWSLKELAAIGKTMGVPAGETEEWLEKSRLIEKSIQDYLWNKNKNWFASIYPNGFHDYVYSIQVFDAIEAGVCSPEMEKSILSHLHENAFLGKYGVSSISKEDTLHYEVVDTDWSGGGSYTGDGPQLALLLYEHDHKELAWDILKRHFWMGANLIYYPQEIFVDKPVAPDHKRANEVSGLIGSEVILFGLIGFQTNYENELFINPKPVADGNILISGFGFWGNKIDIELSTSRLKININGVLFYEGIPQKIKII